jgi:hypothetical protein
MLETSERAAGTGPTMYRAPSDRTTRTVPPLLEFLVGIMSTCELGDDQDDPTRDLPAPQLIQCLVGFGQRARADPATDLPCCG